MTPSTMTLVSGIEVGQRYGSSRLDLPISFVVQNVSTSTSVKTDESLVQQIVGLIASFRISGPSDKYAEEMEPNILDTVRCSVAKQEPINMVVPAYPFKSPNHESKVLGPEPDVGERMTLEHFNSFGARIQEIYAPGGYVTIVSDGPCYNDLLGVSDKEVWDYAQGLHRITQRLGLKHLRFSDLFELVGAEEPPTTAEEYANRIGDLKEHVFSSFTPAGYDFDADLKKDKNALSTYRGYIKFLETDLAMYFREQKMSKSATKKHCSKVARGMIARGKAFGALVKAKAPSHVRLSIHASDNSDKLSVALLPHKRYSTFPVTPWHNTPYLDDKNDSLSLGRKPTDGGLPPQVGTDELGLKFMMFDVPRYRILGAHGAAASDEQLKLQPRYPCGLEVRVPNDTPISSFNLDNLRDLAKLYTPIVFRGLDPAQYTSEVTDEIRRSISGHSLSMSVLQGADGDASLSAEISLLPGAPQATEAPAPQAEEKQKRQVEPLKKAIQEEKIAFTTAAREMSLLQAERIVFSTLMYELSF